MSARRVAAVDLGTNTTLMLVAELSATGSLTSLLDRATITRLGRGVDATGRLGSSAVDRTLDVLRDYAAVARGWSADVVAVGTSAIRDASNRDAFLRPAEAILGCKIETLAGEREAELTFRGALEGLEFGTAAVTVVDIGGGSTEIAVGRGGDVEERVSLDVGAVRLHERHSLSAPASAGQLEAVRCDVANLLAQVPFRSSPTMVSIAGTATTYAAMVQSLAVYDASRIHGCVLSRAQLQVQVRRLARCTLVERHRIPGLHRDRADVIVAGGVILDAIMGWAGVEETTVSDAGVRFGLAREALGRATVD